MLYGKKVILERPREEHVEQMQKWRNNPKFRKFYREYREITLEKQMRYWKEKMIGDESMEFFVISPREEPDTIIGVVGLNYIHRAYRTAEFAITVGNTKYCGNGYGSDALRTVIRYGFDQLNLNRVWGEVYSNNKYIEVYRHVGFKDEGTLRQSVFKDGKYLDSHMIGMLREDYEKQEWSREKYEE